VTPLASVRAAIVRAWRTVAFVPTRRLALGVALLAPLWLLSRVPGGAWVAFGATLLLVAIALLDVAMLPAMRDVEVDRLLEPTIGVGDDAELRYRITSRWGRPLVVALYDELPPAQLAGGVASSEHRLAPHGGAELAGSVRGMARGEGVLGDVALRVRTPVGLVARTLRYERDDRVLVAPSLAGVRRFRWLAVHQRLAAVGVRSTPKRGEGRTFASLRDYVVGDDPRHIDWKASARLGHPITREYTIEQSQTVYLLVDAGRSMTQLAGAGSRTQPAGAGSRTQPAGAGSRTELRGGYSRFEYALSSALVLADVASTAGDRVGAMVFDDQLRALVPAQRGRAALQALRTAMVPLQPSLVEPDYSAAFRALAARQRKRALLVLLTDVIDARAARGLLAHLTRGASRHLAVVVALRNDALLAAAHLPGEPSGRTLYTAAAAEELIAERATALQRMRDAGVVVLDVAPDAMAAAVVNQYLELKARGAL
jgi:uncharacterized protein (DUF58 family)